MNNSFLNHNSYKFTFMKIYFKATRQLEAMHNTFYRHNIFCGRLSNENHIVYKLEKRYP